MCLSNPFIASLCSSDGACVFGDHLMTTLKASWRRLQTTWPHSHTSTRAHRTDLQIFLTCFLLFSCVGAVEWRQQFFPISALVVRRTRVCNCMCRSICPYACFGVKSKKRKEFVFCAVAAMPSNMPKVS